MQNSISTHKVTYTLAKTDDGTIQINFVIPKDLIESTKSKVIEILAKDIEVPGFRKGKAPVEKVVSKISQSTLIEEVVKDTIPSVLTEAVTENKIRPAIYPKLEVIKADETQNWEIRATTAEFPQFELGDYKKIIGGALKSSDIWTPDKGNPEVAKTPTKEEKEAVVIKTLLEAIKVNVPSILVEEEVNARLSGLLSRIEKLGLSLESYLASAGKTPQDLRKDYTDQAKETISLDLILEKIAQAEKVVIEAKQIDDLIAATSADKALSERLNTPDQRRIIEGILRRRAALESLTGLL